MFDRDLSTAGIPSDGTSRRSCRVGRHTPREDGRDLPEPARLAHRDLCRRQSVHAIGGRRRSPRCGHTPALPRFLVGPHGAGQPGPLQAGPRPHQGPHARHPEPGRPPDDARPGRGGPVYPDEVSQRLAAFCSASAAQRTHPLRLRPGRRDCAGGRPGKVRAPLPGPADRRLTGIPRHPAGAIRRPIRDRYPDPARLTTAPVCDMHRGCRAGVARIKLHACQLARTDQGSCARPHPAWPTRRWRTHPGVAQPCPHTAP